MRRPLAPIPTALAGRRLGQAFARPNTHGDIRHGRKSPLGVASAIRILTLLVEHHAAFSPSRGAIRNWAIAPYGLVGLTIRSKNVAKLIPAIPTHGIMPVFCPTRVRFRCVGRVRAESSEPKYLPDAWVGPGDDCAGPAEARAGGTPRNSAQSTQLHSTRRQPMPPYYQSGRPSGIRCLAPLAT